MIKVRAIFGGIMKRFDAIEGLRGWLAWAVVFWHCIYMFGIHKLYPQVDKLHMVGDFAVCLFIIISGFVITNLLLEKREPYGRYIYRRFLRLYPVYIICLALGIIGTYATFEVMLAMPWGELTPPVERMQSQFAEKISVLALA